MHKYYTGTDPGIDLLLADHDINGFSKLSYPQVPDVFNQCAYFICMGNVISCTEKKKKRTQGWVNLINRTAM